MPDDRSPRRDAVADRQRPAGVDERHARRLGVRSRPARGRRLPEPAAAAAGRRARARRPPAHQGRPAQPGRAADQQRQPDRPLDRRFRSGSARAERRIGRSARQSVCRRIRPLLDERHADSHQAGHQRLGDQAGQSHAAIPQVVERRARIRAALLGARPAQARSRVPRPGLSVPLRRDAGEEPDRRAGDRAEELRFLHAGRYRHLRAAHARRRADPVSARSQARDDEHVSTAGGDAGLQPERLVGRHRRPVGARAATSSSRRRCPAGGSRSTSNTDGRAPMVYAPQTQSGSFFNDQEREVAQPAVGRGAQPLARLARPARVQVRHRSAAVAVRRLQRQPAGRDPAPRRVARGADRVRRSHDAGGQRRRVRGVRAGPLARRLAGDVRARPAPGSRRDRRARELVAARRRGDWRRARGARHPARRLREVRAADAAQRRGVSVVRAAHGLTIRARRLAARRAHRPSPTSSTPICAPRKRMSATSNGTSGSAAVCCFKLAFLQRQRLARVHRDAGCQPRGELRLSSDRHVALPGARGDDAVSGRRAAGHHRLVRLGAEARPISTTTISSSATSGTRSSAPTRTA